MAAIREALDENGFQNTIILSYAAKYASAYYGPFRDAVGSKIGTDSISKATYQMDPSNVREALREIALDAEEGADILMVKPAGPYLDVIRAVKESYEPAGRRLSSQRKIRPNPRGGAGWMARLRTNARRIPAFNQTCGADLILTYFAKEVAADL